MGSPSIWTRVSWPWTHTLVCEARKPWLSRNRHVCHIPRWLVLLVSKPLLYSNRPKLLILITRISDGFYRILLHTSIPLLQAKLGELPTYQAKKEEVTIAAPACTTLGRGSPREMWATVATIFKLVYDFISLVVLQSLWNLSAFFHEGWGSTGQ